MPGANMLYHFELDLASSQSPFTDGIVQAGPDVRQEQCHRRMIRIRHWIRCHTRHSMRTQLWEGRWSVQIERTETNSLAIGTQTRDRLAQKSRDHLRFLGNQS